MKKYRDDGGIGDLTLEQWWKLKYELPPHKAHTGKPALDQRQIVTDRLWLQRKDTLWRDYSGTLRQ